MSFNVIRESNGSVRLQSTGTTVYAGDLVGAVTGTTTSTIAFAPLRQAGQGTQVCNSGCTLGGRTGGFTAVVRFTAVGFSFTGTLTFISGTGGLAGLHGTGSFQGTGGPPPDFGTYSISYQFGP
jgi:hypothetical protein